MRYSELIGGLIIAALILWGLISLAHQEIKVRRKARQADEDDADDALETLIKRQQERFKDPELKGTDKPVKTQRTTGRPQK